jgi:hypothetical protein
MTNKKVPLSVTHPELAAQADGWDPTTFTFGSNSRVAWKCELGHMWESAIKNRARGSGCPVCSGRVVLVGFNDLATTHPELAAQADGWDPTTLSAGSNKRVGWKCEQGHVWDVPVNGRSSGQGCPICTNQVVLAGFNDLVTTHPELAAQADGWDPTTLSAGSHKKVQWKCEDGHHWETVLGNRLRGSGCPVCSGHKVLAGFNDLATTNPELAAQADGWDPTTLSAGSGKLVSWRCAQGHVWNSNIDNRSKGNGCPVCSGRKVLAGFNDLATTNPELAAQADGWDPTTLSRGTPKIVGWKCSQGHRWKAGVTSRSTGDGCPICSSHRVQVGFNDLATTNPELAALADGWDPRTLTAGSNKRVAWKCEQGHQSVAPVSQRSQYGCPVCSGHKVLAGFNDLATTHPELAAQADGWDPTTLSAGSSRKVGWKCELEHNWNATVASRAAGNGCAFCSGRAVLIGFNDLATTNPELAALADGWDPRTLTAYSNEKVGWKCELGHKSITTVGSRSAGFGCPVCVNQAILVGYNDLATTNPQLAAQADGWDPTTVTAGNGKKKSWKCEFGHTWKASPNARTLYTLSTSGCPSCAKFGFDPNKNGWLYFIDHDELHMFQIGISNFPEKRLGQHGKRGWEVIEVRGPMDGHLVHQLETAILHAVERRGAILGHKAQIEKFDGYSEAWTKDSLTVTSFKQLLDWVYEDERNIMSVDGK